MSYHTMTYEDLGEELVKTQRALVALHKEHDALRRLYKMRLEELDVLSRENESHRHRLASSGV